MRLLNGPFTLIFKLLPALALLSQPAIAGTLIEQKVSFDSEGKTSSFQFIWAIQGNEFRLNTIRDGERKSFVFNGRVFYICGRLDASQMAVIKKFNVSDTSILASLERGACQELPMDYGVRFLLSPYEAVGSVDVTGGLGTSVGVSPVKITKTTETAKVPGASCSVVKREYELTDRSEAKFLRKVSESPCISDNIKWRHGISRQLGMALLRSPGGQPSYAAMSEDIKEVQGFTLNTAGEMVGMDNFGKAFSSKFQVAARAVQEKDLTQVELGLPKGFDVIDTRALGLRTPASDKPNKKAVSAAPSKGGTGLDMLVKMMILGGNPAAAFIEAIRTDESNDSKDSKTSK